MLDPNFTPLTIGIEKWKKKKKKKKGERKGTLLGLSIKITIQTGQRYSTADEILSVCGPRQRGRIREFPKNKDTLQSFILPFFIQEKKDSVIYFYWRRLSPHLIAKRLNL